MSIGSNFSSKVIKNRKCTPESVSAAGQPSAGILLGPGRQEVGEGHRQEEPAVEAGLRQVHRRHGQEVTNFFTTSLV
jgi:hypothetical protein